MRINIAAGEYFTAYKKTSQDSFYIFTNEAYMIESYDNLCKKSPDRCRRLHILHDLGTKMNSIRIYETDLGLKNKGFIEACNKAREKGKTVVPKYEDKITQPFKTAYKKWKKKWLATTEFAKIMGVSTTTILKYIKYYEEQKGGCK